MLAVTWLPSGSMVGQRSARRSIARDDRIRAEAEQCVDGKADDDDIRAQKSRAS